MKASFSPCGQYRYWLKRPSDLLDAEHGMALFVMLNPSTADDLQDDPTIRRCQGFAKSLGFTGFTVANLYALRATNPRLLWDHEDPVGPENDNCLRGLLIMHSDVICAWGKNAKPDRVSAFVGMADELGNNLWCLGTTKCGAPRHPLYVKANQALESWSTPCQK